MMEIDQIKPILQQDLKPNRYLHSLNTALAAQQLAQYRGADPNKAYLAGLVHDCAKNMNNADLLAAAEQFGIPTDPIILRSPQLIHGQVGAYLAREQFDIHDEEIFNAIAHHTMGRENMSDMEKIIFLADLIEPGRTYENVVKIRKTALTDFDKALLMAYDGIINFIIRKEDLLHPQTIRARNYLLMNA
ncbi:MAG: bis(5'-nucleosyl)-tetraphosphatase (symmetrical) YqeK [Anaerofustis sp.]